MSNVITLLSDFGNRDSYVAQMKAALISQAVKLLGGAVPFQIVDISHEIPPQDVYSGARLLQESAMRFPSGTVHIAVVDPGVGTGRRIVAVEAKEHIFVAPDNGLLSMVLDGIDVVNAFSVENSDLWAPNISATFHGRDIMAPVGGFLALGGKIAEVGPPVGQLHRLPQQAIIGDDALSHSELTLQVIGIDGFGNILTGADRQRLAPVVEHNQLRIVLGSNTVKASMVETYGMAQIGSLVALFGSQGRLELAVVNGSAAQELQVQVGDWVRIHLE